MDETNEQTRKREEENKQTFVFHIYTFSHFYENYMMRGQFKIANVLPIFFL